MAKLIALHNLRGCCVSGSISKVKFMKEKVYVFGHQNPDTDSICSAISYAHLKNQLDDEFDYVPVGLKEVNKETEYVLGFFDLDRPKIISSLKPQVMDINLRNGAFVKEDDSIRDVLDVLLSQTGRILPVVDEDDRLIGIVSITDIVPRLLGTENKSILKETKTPFGHVIKELSLKKIFDDYQPKADKEHVEGMVYLATDLIDNCDLVTKMDIVICNHTEWKTFVEKAGAIIIGGMDDNEKVEGLKTACRDYLLSSSDKGGSVYYSAMSNLELVKGLAKTTPITSMVKKDGLEYFATYETIDDVKENMMTSHYRRFPVVNEQGQIKGLLSRSDLVDINKKKAILVDHNERGQSIEGIEDIDILEIIDHHRVADVMTIAPLYFRVEPVGCTATIIARMYEEHGMTIPKHIAGLMMSAIISDTLLFNSPTCTDLDVATAKKLAEIVGVDIRMYGMKMISSGSDLGEQTPNQILNNDRKKFMFGKYKVTIAQINTGDFDGFFSVFEGIMEEMQAICAKDGFNLFVLLVTDAVVGGTEIIPIGDSRWIVEEAFGLKPTDQSMFLTGVFSRKKQVVPKLMNAARL